VNRVLVVVLALVATPFVTSVAQHVREIKPAKGAPQATGPLDNPGLGHDAAHCAMRAALHPGETINKCPDPVTDPGTPPPPPQPPPTTTGACGSAPAGGGSVTIDGQVYSDASPWPGLAGWCVQLSLHRSADRHLHGVRSAPGQLAPDLPRRWARLPRWLRVQHHAPVGRERRELHRFRQPESVRTR